MSQVPRALLPFALLVACTSSLIIRQSFIASTTSPSSTRAPISKNRLRMNKVDEMEAYEGGDYKVYVGRGMARFRSGRVAASIADFDTAMALQPSLIPYMWQRGLSLYYADRFEEGAKQFRRDIAVNPNDTEEAIWAFMCDARTDGVGFQVARQRLVKVSSERRPYMRAAYSLFRGETTESELARQMETNTVNDDAKASAPYFYANLYLGLFSEAKGDEVLARKYMNAAVSSAYGKSRDYMYDVARVHRIARGW